MNTAGDTAALDTAASANGQGMKALPRPAAALLQFDDLAIRLPELARAYRYIPIGDQHGD